MISIYELQKKEGCIYFLLGFETGKESNGKKIFGGEWVNLNKFMENKSYRDIITEEVNKDFKKFKQGKSKY